VSGLSGCPVIPSDLQEHPGQSKLELSGLSGAAETRTAGGQEVSGLSGCPVIPSDLQEHPGQSKLELSGLSGAADAEGMAT
ncbi:hypothetical protein ACIQXD_28165, partial [Streptomyces uncialis]